MGQLLIDAGVLTHAQLDEALRAQVLYGGRLGTNLVDLDFVSLDVLANALGHLHGMVPALSHHFERCDVAVQERLPPEFAAIHLVVPIGYLADGTDRIAVAVADPPSEQLLGQLAGYLECDASQIIAAIAGELRLRFYMERCYGIARTSRFLRVRRPSGTHIPIPQVTATYVEEPGSSTEVTFPPPPPSPEPASGGFEVTTDAEQPLVPDTKRRFVRTISEQLTDGLPPSDAVPITMQDLASYATVHAAPTSNLNPYETLTPEAQEHLEQVERLDVLGDAQPLVGEPFHGADAHESGESEASAATLGRVGVRRLERALPADAAALAPQTLEQTLRAIRRAESRDLVAELALGALARFSPAPLSVAVLFVVREHYAIGWKGHAMQGDLPALDQLAVDLRELSLLGSAHQLGSVVTLAPINRDPAFVDRRLWQALAVSPPPREAACCPVVIGGHSVCLYYVHSDTTLSDTLEPLRAIAEATATAFARMFRAAQR